MSLEKIVASIESKGLEGIKKTELRREFHEEKEIDSILQGLAESKEIFVEKKGNAFYCWHKNYYLKKLVSTDQKFSALYTLLNSMSDSLSTQIDSVNAKLDSVNHQMKKITEEINLLDESRNRTIGMQELNTQERTDTIHINYDKFKEQLDQALSNASNSIGWADLGNLRKVICSKMDISQEQFYHSFEEVVSKDFDKYELSTGGEEGIQLRGMVHGFVRCI